MLADAGFWPSSPAFSARCTARRKWPSWAWALSWRLPKALSSPLRFIELHYRGAGKDVPGCGPGGQGITFDTGGISIKPAGEMDEMKFDMCGAASVLGVFKALAELQPTLNVVGLIPACENMPDGRAVKPGDVVTSMSGQTIEFSIPMRKDVWCCAMRSPMRRASSLQRSWTLPR